MHALTGCLEMRPESRPEARGRWSEGLDQACRFGFFECRESEESSEAQRAQPHDHRRTTGHLSMIVGAGAQPLTVPTRRSATGG